MPGKSFSAFIRPVRRWMAGLFEAMPPMPTMAPLPPMALNRMRAVCSAGPSSDQLMCETQLSPKSQGCRSADLFQIGDPYPPAFGPDSTIGRQLGASLASQARAARPPVLVSSALMSASDFSELPLFSRWTRSDFFRPALSRNDSPPETTECQYGLLRSR